MIYVQKPPPDDLSDLIRNVWIMDSEEDCAVSRQKIIPDGFPEVIFHYGDPYLINITGEWQTQEKELLAGQIRNHFTLENSGHSRIIGIKMMPTAVTHLWKLEMNALTREH